MVAIFGGGKGGGVCFAFPDVCKTPAPPAPFQPIPYPNIGTTAGSKTSTKVKVSSKDTAMKTSTGDKGGVMKGVISSRIRDSARWSKASGKVKVTGKPAVHALQMTSHNGGTAAQLRGHMASVHQKIQALPATASPQDWQDLLEDYILSAVAVYRQINPDDD